MKPKVCLTGIDGLRLDLARGTHKMPTLDAVIGEGVFNELTMEVPTLSGPGASTPLTGASHAEHGVKDNHFVGHQLLHCPDFLSRAYFADQSTATMVAAGWPPLADPTDTGPEVWERREQQRAGHGVRLLLRRIKSASQRPVERRSFVAATRFGRSLDHWPAELAPTQLDPLLLECRPGQAMPWRSEGRVVVGGGLEPAEKLPGWNFSGLAGGDGRCVRC